MTQTIEQLQAKVAELEAEVERLKRTNSSYANLTKAQESQLTNLRQRLYQLKGADSAIDSERQANCDLTDQLAAEQLNNKLLRDALRALDDYCDPANHTSFCECDPTVGYQCAVCHWPRIQEVAEARAALSTPASTEALDAYVAEKVKELEAELTAAYKSIDDNWTSHQKIVEANRQRDLTVEALENCRLLAARHRKEEWAGHIMRFCKDAGLSGSPIRNDSREILVRMGIEGAESMTSGEVVEISNLLNEVAKLRNQRDLAVYGLNEAEVYMTYCKPIEAMREIRKALLAIKESEGK